jgi:multiple sugar transport system permease protein
MRTLVTHLALIGLGLTFLLPFYWLVTTALKPDKQIFAVPPVLWPSHPQWQNFAQGVQDIPFLTYTLNTLKICVLTVGGTILSSSLVAYSLAKIRWKGRNLLFYSLIAVMILPGQVTMVPTFMINKWLGWVGTILPLVVPPFFGGAFSIFLLRQFFMTLPNDLSDAARLDGCSEFSIYWRIAMPLAKPALITVGLFAFVGSWNDFLGPLLYLNDERQYTLAIGLQKFLSQHSAQWGKLMAASTVMILPIILLFFFAQRAFIQGITLTGSKE